MVASPLAASVVTAILRRDFGVAKHLTKGGEFCGSGEFCDRAHGNGIAVAFHGGNSHALSTGRKKKKTLEAHNPKNLLRLFFALKIFFSEVIFRDPPKIPFKASIKITSRGYFYFLRLFFALQGYF